MNMNSEKTSGKNFRPSAPAVLRLDIELMNRVDFHPRGSLSTGLAGNRNSNVVTSCRRSASA
jgi:hypothetical protein